MGLVDIGLIEYPKFFSVGDTGSDGALTLDAAGEKVGIVFQIPKTGSITKLEFFIDYVSSAQTLKAGLYTIDSSGNPTSTAYGGMATGTVSPGAGGWKTVTLATPASATRGDFVACVIEFNSTIGNLGIGYWNNAVEGFPYTKDYTGSWSAGLTRGSKLILHFSDVREPWPLFHHYSNPTTYSWNSGTATPYRGQRITMQFKARISGAKLFIASSGDYEVIFTKNHSVQATITMDKDYNASTTARSWAYLILPTPIEVVAGDVLRIIVHPTTVTNVELRIYNVPAQGLGYGKANVNWFIAADATGTSYSESATQVVQLASLIDQLESGAGGLLVHPGMSGGMRG